jgi:two-component system nitrogen regulation sensor histidine kinase NtrY
MIAVHRRRSTTAITLAVTLDFVLIAVALGAALHLLFGIGWREAALLSSVLFGLAVPLVLITIRFPFRRLRKNLQAITDGVRGFADGDFSLRLHVTGDDEITELVSLYNEMGEVLRAQRNESLQKELLLETVFQATPLSILLTNDSGRVVFANRAARDLFTPGQRLKGRKLDEILRRSPTIHDVFDAENDTIFKVADDTFQLARRTFHFNTRRHVLWIVNRLTPELRRQEVEIWKRAIRILNHELNNSLAPVRSLFNSARIIRDRPEHREKLDEINETIDERLDYLQRFLDGYAQFARLPAPRRAETSWRELLESLQRLTPFRIEPPLPTPPVYLDRSQIEQVVINLVKNAVEAGSPPEEIVVSIQERAGGSMLAVADRGSGMDDETMTRALLPFYSTKREGSGLGLALCSEIITAHGGEVRIVRRPDGGMVVSCWIAGKET